MKNVHIAVTGINATDNPGPGSGVIRSIRYNPDFKTRIIGLAYDIMDPGNFLPDLVDKPYLIPYPSQEPRMLLERLAHINSIERIDVLIPTLDAELLNFIKIQDELAEIGIRTFLPSEEKFKMRSKNLLADFCKDNDIASPKTYSVGSVEQLYRMEVRYPVYVKGLFYDATLATSMAEAVNAFHRISYQWGLPVVIQEFIQGEEFDIVALGDGTGETIGAVPMRKMSLTDKKKAWAGVSIDNPTLVEITRKLIRALKWRGPMEVEIMVDNKTDDHYLIEINPRFPAWCFLAPGSGQNLPEALVRLALKEEVTPFSTYEVGKLFVRYSSEVLADIKDIEQLTTTGTLAKGESDESTV